MGARPAREIDSKLRKKYLLAEGATYVHLAAHFDFLDIAQFLIDSGAELPTEGMPISARFSLSPSQQAFKKALNTTGSIEKAMPTSGVDLNAQVAFDHEHIH